MWRRTNVKQFGNKDLYEYIGRSLRTFRTEAYITTSLLQC